MRLGILFLGAVAGLWAQLPELLPIPSGSTAAPAAMGTGGDLWIAGVQDLIGLGRDGRTQFLVRLDPLLAHRGLAVAPDGLAAVVSTDFVSGRLTVVNGRGELVRQVELPGVPAAIASDAKGGWVVAGRASDGFVATPGAYKTEMGEKNCSYSKGQEVACDDAYVMKIGTDGGVVWATLFGGASDDFAEHIAVDAAGSVWIAGETQSFDMPVTHTAAQRSYGGGETFGPVWFGDAFVARFDATGAQLEYSTYLGGARLDQIRTLTVVPEGVLVGGRTESANFPVSGAAYQRELLNPERVSLPGTAAEAFVTLFSREGAMVYSSYFGGAQSMSAAGLGEGREVLMSVNRKSDAVCVVRLQLDGAETKLSPGCGIRLLDVSPQPLYWNGSWIGVGQTPPGLPVPGISPFRYATITRFGDTAAAPTVAAVWAPGYPRYRTAVTPDSLASIYLPVETNLSGVGVSVGGRQATVLFAGQNQINFHVPADLPLGIQDVRVEFRFFTGIPVPVDVAPRWPGLGGTVEGEAARGEVVRLIATGLGAPPYTGLEAYIETEDRFGAQGMEIVSVDRVGAGVFHVSVRIPQNAKRPGAQVRLVYQVEGRPILSNLVGVGVR